MRTSCSRLKRSARAGVGSSAAGVDAKEVSTLHGTITLDRPYFYCDVCVRSDSIRWTRHCSSLRSTISFDVQEGTTRLGADLLFGLSAEECAHPTGLRLSPISSTRP
jgi:hypothetical protein